MTVDVSAAKTGKLKVDVKVAWSAELMAAMKAGEWVALKAANWVTMTVVETESWRVVLMVDSKVEKTAVLMVEKLVAHLVAWSV